MALQKLLRPLFCRLPFRSDFVLANRRSTILLLTGAGSAGAERCRAECARRQQSICPKKTGRQPDHLSSTTTHPQ